MKKFLSIFFAAVLVLMATGSAMADHRVWQGAESNFTFSVGGQIEIDGFWQDKFPAFPDDDKKYYNQETRVFFKGQWGEVEGMVRLEWDYDWDYDSQNKGNTTDNALDLAWLKFPIPYTPVKIAAGLQPLFFGKSILLDDDVYMLDAILGIDKFTFILATIKMNETYVVDDDYDAYAFIFGTSAVPNHDIQVLFAYLTNQAIEDHKMWDLGLSLNGGMAMLNYWLEGHYQGGTIAEDVDLSAFAVALGANAGFGIADVGLWMAYGSGDDDDADDKEKAFQPVSPWFKPDLIVIDNLNGSSVANLFVIAAKGTIKPLPPLSAWLQVGYYARNEEVVDGEKGIGVECDLGATWKINDFMIWKVTFGYLFAGDGIAAGYDESPFELNNEFLVTF